MSYADEVRTIAQALKALRKQDGSIVLRPEQTVHLFSWLESVAVSFEKQNELNKVITEALGRRSL